MSESITELTGQDASIPWQRLERHLNFGVGFSFVFIVVDDENSVTEPSQFLLPFFAQNQISLRVFIPPLPDLVYSLPELVLGLPANIMASATLVVGNSSRGRHGVREWENAWRHTVSRLNEQRDVLRTQMQTPLIFAGPTWLMRLLRDEAPDLWSARALVLRHPKLHQPGPAQSSPIHAGEDSIEDLIRRTSLVELMDRFREFPQPLSPETLLRWREREVALVLHRLHELRLRQTAERGDGLLSAVLAAAWCLGAHRDRQELSSLLDEIKRLLDPRGPSGLALSVSEQRDFWPQYLALDAWHSALSCNWSQANQRAQEAIEAAALFIGGAITPLSASTLAGVSLAQDVVTISCAMTGNESFLARFGRSEMAQSAADLIVEKAAQFSAQRRIEHGLWLLAHHRFREAEKYLRAFYDRSASNDFIMGSREVYVFVKQAIIVCLLAQRRLPEAEAEAEQLAACLHPESIGMRQFVHGNYVLFVVHLLCRRKVAAKMRLLYSLRIVEQSPSKNESELRILRLLLMYAALFDGDIALFQSTIETMQRQTNTATLRARALEWALWGVRYIPGLATWISYSFWCSQCVDFLERTRVSSGNSRNVLASLKLYAYKAMSIGWRTEKCSSAQPRK